MFKTFVDSHKNSKIQGVMIILKKKLKQKKLKIWYRSHLVSLTDSLKWIEVEDLNESKFVFFFKDYCFLQFRLRLTFSH